MLSRMLAVRSSAVWLRCSSWLSSRCSFRFRQIENLINVTRNFSFVGIVAMGMTLVILTGGIDLSVRLRVGDEPRCWRPR